MMNRLVGGTSPTSSGVIATTIIAGTMSLLLLSPQNNVFFEKNTDRNQPHYSFDGTHGSYGHVFAIQIATQTELKRLVDKVFNSQIAPDIELDNIIVNKARKLYQYGFSE